MLEKDFMEAMEAYEKDKGIFEIRLLKTNQGIVSGYFDNLADAYQAVEKCEETAYFTLQDIRQNLLSKGNRLRTHVKNTTKDEDVLSYRFLHIDCDPVRPSGVQATEKEVEAGKKKLKEITCFLTERFGYPEPIVVFSGNGHTADYYIESMENSPENVCLIKNVLKSLSERFSDGDVQIDTTVYSPSQIIKIPGTVSKKGKKTEERKYRYSRLVSYPKEHREVGREQLEAVIDCMEETRMNRKRIEETKEDLKRAGITFRENKRENNIILELENSNNRDSQRDYIKFEEKGKVSARYHKADGNIIGWEELKQMIAGNETKANKKKNDVKIQNILDELMKSGEIVIYQDKSGNCYVDFWQDKSENEGGERAGYYKTCSMESEEFRFEIIQILEGRMGLEQAKNHVEDARFYLRYRLHQNKTAEKVTLSKRIYNDGTRIIYMLNEESCVEINGEESYIGYTPGKMFLKCQGMESQMEPDFSVQPEELEKLIRRNFYFKKKNDRILFTLYLCSCFFGVDKTHEMPILSIAAEKGSSKSTMLRHLQAIVDPHNIDITAIPKKEEDIAIRLSKALVTCFDNLSYISRDVSDLFCQAVTGGVYTKRRLYKDEEEIMMDIKGIVAINGTSLVAKASDLLERCVILNLEKIPPEKLKTEKEIQEIFEEDLPKILGACMNCVKEVLADDVPIETDYKTRMTHFFETAIRCGRVLGIEEEEIVAILKRNQKMVNQQSLGENLVAEAVLLYMKGRDQETMSVTEFLKELKEELLDNGYKIDGFPGQPNVLSRRLNEIKSDLENEYHITFQIKNTGKNKEICIINKDKRK